MTTLAGSSTLRDYRGVDALHDRLRRVHSLRWRLRVLEGLAGLTALAAASVGFAALLGYWPGQDQPPSPLRWAMLGMVVLAAAVGLFGWVVRSLLWRQNPAQTARFLETVRPDLRNDLVNAVLLAREADPPSPALVQRAIAESLDRSGDLDLARCVSRQSFKRRSLLAVGLIAAVLAFAMLQPTVVRRGLRAVFTPRAFVPALNRVELIDLTPGDVTVYPGEPVAIRLEVRDAPGTTAAEVLFDEEEQPRPMRRVESDGELGTADPTATFALRLEAVHQPLRYAVRAAGPAGQSRWPPDRPWYRIDLHRLAVEDMTVRYEYPPYRNLPPRTETLAADSAAFAAPVGSWATLRLTLDAPAPAATLHFDDGRQVKMTPADDALRHSARFPIRATGHCRLVLADTSGKVIKRLPADTGRPQIGWPVTAQPDAPPSITLLAPARDVTVPLGKDLPVKLHAADDVGFSNLQLLTARGRADPSPVEDFRTDLTGQKDLVVTHRLSLAGLAAGESITLLAAATDNRKLGDLGGPQTTRTKPLTVTVRDPKRLARQQIRQLAELQRRLLAILELQLMHRNNTRLARSGESLREVRRIGGELHVGQRAVHAALSELAEHFDFPPALDDLRKALDLLLSGEARLAIDQAGVLKDLAKLDARNRACDLLGGTQDDIIAVLQDMLAIMPSLAAKAGLLDSLPGSDLPPDQRKQKREDLRKSLEQFIAEQKKVIAASDRLNKKPLDDFTPADEKLLKELQAVQDKWEKFLNEAFTDFSRLARQDFANPSMLKELLSVKADVTMAKDALKKKAVEIATACEDNGVENAEELTANLEKWLPDEPDRKKWNMEAPEQPMDIEQAELFTELEDLVGDLLEEEEDLFEEMDDLTSQAFMSGDKAIGWDAQDGPISNMNAQGVTGNQLPNTSEISGRSGEGRTGKSGGEFVEDKAVGKGGRRTPTRMTDDPFQTGQVDDVSTDPPGGATGGGKHSGAGEEGLEGPTPAEVSAEIKRLAGRQAQLVNRAERIQANFRAGDYASFTMAQAVRLMKRLGTDLDRGDYRNALRRRRATVSALRQTRRMVGTGLDVTRDTSSDRPKVLRDDLHDARQGNLPAEYRPALEEYFRRLSEEK